MTVCFSFFLQFLFRIPSKNRIWIKNAQKLFSVESRPKKSRKTIEKIEEEKKKKEKSQEGRNFGFLYEKKSMLETELRRSFSQTIQTNNIVALLIKTICIWLDPGDGDLLYWKTLFMYIGIISCCKILIIKDINRYRNGPT